MTAQVATTVTADLKKAVANGLTFEQLEEQLRELVLSHAASEVEAAFAPSPAELTPVTLSEAERKALRGLPAEAESLATPAAPRALTPEEISEYLPLLDRAKAAKAAATKVETRLVEAFHGHLDAALPDDLPRDKKGHKLAKGEVVDPNYAQKVVRDLRGGSIVPPSEADLLALVEAGVITRAEYLRATHPVTTREVVPNALMALIKKRPELVDALAERAQVTEQTLAVRLANNS